MKKVAVILAGCGRADGSEIHESVLTLLSIRQNNGEPYCFAPNLSQHHVTNHLTNEVMKNETRNMLVEASRIARGEIQPLEELQISSYDALIIPGGNGVAYNLCDFALKGPAFTVNPLVKKICLDFTNATKPVGFICIAPVMIPKIYGPGLKLTIGNDESVANILKGLGAIHSNKNVDEIEVDEGKKIVTTPAYMLAKDVLEAYTGIKNVVDKIFALM